MLGNEETIRNKFSSFQALGPGSYIGSASPARALAQLTYFEGRAGKTPGPARTDPLIALALGRTTTPIIRTRLGSTPGSPCPF